MENNVLAINRDDYQLLILDSLPHWAMLIDGDTRTILAANKLAKELGSKIQGQCWDDFGHRLSLDQEHLELITKCPERKRDNIIKCTFCEADEAIQNRTSHVADVEIDGLIWQTHWVPVRDNIYLHYAIDVTETKKIEQLKLDKEKLNITIKTAGGITHEMAQPLQVAMAHLGLLQDQVSNPKNVERAKSVYEALEKMQRIVHQLQKVTQVKTKKYLNSEILDIEESSKDLTNG